MARWSRPFSAEAKPQSSPESPTGTARQGQRAYTGPEREHESERVFGAILGDLTRPFLESPSPLFDHLSQVQTSKRSTGTAEASVESFLGTGTAPPGGAPAHSHWSLTRGGSGLIVPTWAPCEGGWRGLEHSYGNGK